MALAGWKTEAIFNRYNVVSPDDLEAGLAKVAKHRGSAAAGKRVSHAIRPRSGPEAAQKRRRRDNVRTALSVIKLSSTSN
jgi:hypothetical protein